jgi:hypothetical protein
MTYQNYSLKTYEDLIYPKIGDISNLDPLTEYEIVLDPMGADDNQDIDILSSE